MDMVTTVPWSEVATRSDIQALRSEMATLGTGLRSEMAAHVSGLATKGELERMGRRIISWGATFMVALAVLAFTAGRAIPS